MIELVEVERAEDLPDSGWASDDPRRTKAWSSANRWPADGVSFLVSRTGSTVFAAVRRQRNHNGWRRMNAVEICAGLGRQVDQEDAVLSAARREYAVQLNLALAGYTTPVWAEDNSPETLAQFVSGISAMAEREAARPSVLHMERDPALLKALRGLGWTVGVTDLYAVISDIGSCLDDYLAGLTSKQRVNVRRDLRRLVEQGGRAEIVQGMEIARHHNEIATLEAGTDRRHGIGTSPENLRAMNEQLLMSFGTDMAVALVRDERSEIMASCTLLSTGRRVLPRFVGFAADERVRQFAAYFHVAYYLPLQHALAKGATELLMGPGSLQPKLARGARLRPLYSAVPPGTEALGALLRNTDRAMRDQADRLGFPIISDEEVVSA